MARISALLLTAALALTACGGVEPPAMGPDGKPLPHVYRIPKGEEGDIQYRMLDSVNTLRQASGRGALVLNPMLNAAAATHSRDMAAQNRPWHFGSDGSSPLDRVRRAGYAGAMLGENISETYETELETLAAWMELPDTANVVLDPAARDLGVAFYQESSGKIWWTLITGG